MDAMTVLVNDDPENLCYKIKIGSSFRHSATKLPRTRSSSQKAKRDLKQFK